jgi:hypothetical protein
VLSALLAAVHYTISNDPSPLAAKDYHQFILDPGGNLGPFASQNSFTLVVVFHARSRLGPPPRGIRMENWQNIRFTSTDACHHPTRQDVATRATESRIINIINGHEDMRQPQKMPYNVEIVTHLEIRNASIHLKFGIDN